jgi:hypothetical protein
MADGKLPLSPASPGGQVEDIEQLNVPIPAPPPPGPGLIALVRQRIQTVGRLYNQIAAVLDADPALNEFGLVTRGVNAAKETTLLAGNVLLTAIRDRLPALLVGGRLDTNIGAWLGSTAPTIGQKTMAQSVPVVLPSDQAIMVSVGTPDKTAFTYGTTAQQPVGGVYQDAAPGLAAGTSGALRLTQNRGLHSNLRNDAGAETGTAATPLRTDPTGTTTQPISAVALPLPTGAATSANQTNGAQLARITDGVETADVTAANALKVDGSAVTQPVSAASLPLPTGAATEATLATRLADATFTARINTLGQKTSVNSTPVVLASDQSAIPVTGPLTDAQLRATPVPISAAALPLPTGAATAANQTTLGSQTTKLNDGTNTATVKAASTPAVATDTALVVALSPNNGITVTPNTVGTQGNAWNAAAVLAGGVSAAIDCQFTSNISVFGNTSGPTLITIQFSQDNVNFYDATSSAANGDFSISGIFGARYLRLKSSQARTITATIAGKD